MAERTGLSQEVLRVWERRYGVVEPSRGEGGQRLYTDADVERLRLLRRATLGGRSIGRVAGLDPAELLRLVQEDDQAGARVPEQEYAVLDAEVENALAHAGGLNGAGLEAQLRRVLVRVGVQRFLSGVAAPLLRRVGDEWHAGRLTPAHEHLATSTVHRVVTGAVSALSAAPDAPSFVVASLAGDRHEMGVLLAAASAAAEGWRVVYLGADLPAADIVAAAQATSAAAVGVSVVYVDSLERVAGELRAVRAGLSPSVQLLAGGAGAAATVDAAAPGIVLVGLDNLGAALRRVWSPAGEAGAA